MGRVKRKGGWLVWTIAGVWAGTALAVFVTTRIHPSTAANVTLNVSKLSFRTNAKVILTTNNEEQLLVSGVRALQVQLSSAGAAKREGATIPEVSLNIEGGPSASCTFYQVRSSGFDLAGITMITLGVPGDRPRSFSLQTHGALSGSLTSRPAEPGLIPGFECRNVIVNGVPAEDVEAVFSSHGGETGFLSTMADARLDLILTPKEQVDDTQIPILGPLRFVEVDPYTGEEKTVLLKPSGNAKNEVVFDNLDKKVSLDDADLLVVVPKSDFYLRQFTVKDGIQISLHGVVHDVRAGAGASDLRTQMPSLFDHLYQEKPIYGVIPVLVTLILGIMDRMGVGKNENPA